MNINCQVSAWNEWGPINSKGIARRYRTIITTPLNKGDPCPPLEETKTGTLIFIRPYISQIELENNYCTKAIYPVLHVWQMINSTRLLLYKILATV